MTEEQNHNEEVFDRMLSTVDPELWRIRQALKDTGVNPIFIPNLINAIYEVTYLHGHGTIQMHISKGTINLETLSRIKLDVKALLEEIG